MLFLSVFFASLGKYVVQAFLRGVAEKYSWNPTRYMQVLTNLKWSWRQLEPEHRINKYMTLQDFESICNGEPSIFLSDGMKTQVLAAIEDRRKTLYSAQR